MTHAVTWASGEATSHWQDPNRLGTPFRIRHEGFTLTGLVLPDGTITNVEIQDCRHVVKCLCAWVFTCVSGRTLHRGDEIVCAGQLIMVFERFDPSVHRILKKWVYRQDRQCFRGPVGLSGLGVRDCLLQMQSWHSNFYDPSTKYEPERTAGTLEYMELISKVIRIHLSQTLSNVERIEMASDVLNDVRFWRNHIHYTQGFSLSLDFMSRQTFEHMTMEMHSICLHIAAFERLCKSQPTDVEETGSNECEETFSELGGDGLFQGRRRDYSLQESLDRAGDVNQMCMWSREKDPSLRIQYGSCSTHLKYDASLQEKKDVPAADLRVKPTPAEQVAAFERGLQTARTRAVNRGMVLTGKLQGTTLTGEELMAKPWLGEGQLLSKMREKSDIDAEEESAPAPADAATSTAANLAADLTAAAYAEDAVASAPAVAASSTGGIEGGAPKRRTQTAGKAVGSNASTFTTIVDSPCFIIGLDTLNSCTNAARSDVQKLLVGALNDKYSGRVSHVVTNEEAACIIRSLHIKAPHQGNGYCTIVGCMVLSISPSLFACSIPRLIQL